MGIEMPEKRKRYDGEFREGAVRIVEETGKPIVQVVRDLGVNEGTLGNWVNRAREAAQGTRGLSKDDVEELKRLRVEVAELCMERDVLKRRLSDVIYRCASSPTPKPLRSKQQKRAREGTAGRLKDSARSTYPRISTLRISHFPDPQRRRYAEPRDAERRRTERPSTPRLDTEGHQMRMVC
jgi:transposase